MKNLTEKTLLVSLIISQWSARKYDRKATDEVNQNHGSRDAGRFNKILVGKEHLEAIGKIAGKARTFHYENTLPWGDNGERLLPVENYFEYTAQIAQLKNDFEIEVSRFERDYPVMIDEARRNLNGLFNDKDYPAHVGDRFQVKTCFMPMPNAQDIRVNLSLGEVETLRANITQELEQRFRDATQDIYRRVNEVLTAMRNKLNEDGGVFRNSLFENVKDLVTLLPRLNVSGDPVISEVCQDMGALYCDPELVRNDKRLREDKASEVQGILDKMQGFFQPA